MPKGRRKWWLMAAIFLLIATASLLVPFYAEICEKNTYTGNKECAAYQITVFFILYIEQVLEAHAGAITGVATTLLAVITWRLVTLGREQSLTTRRQLRAYIGIEGFQAHLHGNEISVGVTLKNFGQTPGYNFQTWTDARIGNPGEEVFGQRGQPVQTSIIGPGTGFSAPSERRPAPKAIRDEIEKRQKVIFAWGEATYCDAFGTNWIFRFRGTATGRAGQIRTSDGPGTGWGITPAGYDEIRAP